MKKYVVYILAISLFLNSCDESNEAPQLDVPDNYEFTRNGQSTVSFQGQLDRRSMLAAMKSEVSKGDKGEIIDAQKLLNQFANQNNVFEEASLNSSGKQLENKTFAADVQFFKTLFTEAAQSSQVYSSDPKTATEGTIGRLQRGTSDKYILVNEKGWEFTQFVEKGLMGAVFLHQIYNTYLTEDRIGSDVDNENVEEGKNYTELEHHWDEAFGYFGAPVDFPRNDEDLYWAKYAGPALNVPASQLNIYGAIKDAFLTGRAAIVANNHTMKYEQRDILYEQLELAAAAASLHYINGSKDALSANDTGTLFHELSEAYNFVMALKYSPRKRITNEQISTILNSNFGEDANFWKVTIEGLNSAQQTLADLYPELSEFKDVL